MTKYQLDHFCQKVKRNFDPLIEEQELLVKQFRTEATKRIVGKLAKKMGADKIIDAFKKAEAQLERVRQDAKTFFVKNAKTKDKKEKLNDNFTNPGSSQEISLADCKEQLREWAKDLVDRELRRRPEGEQLAQLEAVKQKAMDIVYENGDDQAIATALDGCTKKIGITWVVDTSKIKQLAAQ